MFFSKNNIVLELEKDDQWNYLLFNSLVGNVDFLNREYVEYIRQLKSNAGKTKKDSDKNRQLMSRGYLYNNEEEEMEKIKLFIDHFNSSIEKNKRNSYQVILRNSCSEGCSYCKYRERLDNACMSPGTLDNVMRLISIHDQRSGAKEKPLLSIGGGESLPDSDEGYALIKKVLEEYGERFAQVTFQTFGFNFERYKSLLLECGVDRISFVFRLLENEALYERDVIMSESLAETVDALRMHGMQTVMALKITETNVGKLPGYINYFIERGLVFSQNCRILGKPTHKENCSIFSTCTTDYSLYQTIFSIYDEYPQLEFVNFSGRGVLTVLQYLLKMRERFSPRTFFCEANWNFLMVDPKGDIFPCHHGLRDKSFAVGNIDSEPVIDYDKLSQWRGRHVQAIEGCAHCSAKYLCSGGCAFEALAKTKNLYSSDCQPYENLIKDIFENMHQDFLESERYADTPE
jgi:radical SAM protein with 4Fe4S-binding SPASM domain